MAINKTIQNRLILTVWNDTVRTARSACLTVGADEKSFLRPTSTNGCLRHNVNAWAFAVSANADRFAIAIKECCRDAKAIQVTAILR